MTYTYSNEIEEIEREEQIEKNKGGKYGRKLQGIKYYRRSKPN